MAVWLGRPPLWRLSQPFDVYTHGKTLPFDGMSASNIIHRADMAMYQAKGSEGANYVLAESVT